MLGEFYTPQRVVKSLHSLAIDKLGDIYSDYVVWDPAWGSGNLTKDNKFKSLFCSTLRDIDIRKWRMNNKEATKFQYDFLNDDISQLKSIQNRLTDEYKMPEELLEHIENNDKILFLMNPPYAGNSSFGSGNDSEDSKKGATQNEIQKMMNADKMSSAATNLYTQFLYRVIKMKEAYHLDNVAIAIICPPQYLTAASYKIFRELMFKNFRFRGAKYIRASEFDGLANTWGISLTVWDSGESEDKEVFTHKVIEYDSNENEILLQEKGIYNLDYHMCACDWLRSYNNNAQRAYMPNQSSGVVLKDKAQLGIKDAIMHIGYKGNSIYHNEIEVLVTSGTYSDGVGIGVTPDNFDYGTMYYASRKLFTRQYMSWINDKDEYCRPLLESEDADVQEAISKLKTEGLVYTIFNQSNHCTSMKNAWYIDGAQNIKVPCRMKNEFFFLTKQRLLELSGGYLNDSCFDTDNDAFVALKLQQYREQGILSEEALRVLQFAEEIYADTFKLRAEFNAKYPQYEVENWDAGWYQIKNLLKEYDNDKFKRFNETYKQLWIAMQDKDYVHKAGILFR